MHPAVFQSAPLTKARGDIFAGGRRPLRRCFNPLPSQKQGETEGIHPPDQPGEVSIRSPHKSKGRQTRYFLGDDGAVFQSAPLTKARGDPQPQGVTPSATGFNPLPSQKQGETSPPRPRLRARYPFQSAPLTKARGDSPSSSLTLRR